MKIGLFGGSFDPVHRGHLLLAEAALHAFALDRVIFVPAFQPPHKKRRPLSPACRRLRMLSLALTGHPRFSVSRYELKRKTTTYTWQTVRYFRKRFPAAELYFIIGTDSLADLATWRRIDLLARDCVFIAGRRQGAAHSAVAPAGTRVLFTPGTIPGYSSTEIRETAAGGRPLRTLVPPRVAAYIRRTGLYRRPACDPFP